MISTAPGQDSLSASANLSIGPFVLCTATFTLDDSGLSFDAGWNNLGFGGHVDASFGEDSHGGLIVQLGSGTELSILGQTLGLSGEIDSDGTYSFTGQMSLNAGPLDLGASTSFTLGNNGLTFGASWDFLGFKGGVGGGLLDDSSGYFIFIDRTKTYLSILALTLYLGGNIEPSSYDLYGSTTIKVAGLTLASADFTVSNQDGELAFQASANLVLLTVQVSGTIDGSGIISFTSTAGAGSASIAGFGFSMKVQNATLDTAHGQYSLTLTSTVNVFVASVGFTATANWSGSGGPSFTFTGGASIGGILADILEGNATFTVNPGDAAVGFSGSLQIPGLPSPKLAVNASIDGNQDLTGIPGLPSLNDLLNLIKEGAAALGSEAAKAWHSFAGYTSDAIAQGLNNLLPGDPSDVVNDLQDVFGAQCRQRHHPVGVPQPGVELPGLRERCRRLRGLHRQEVDLRRRRDRGRPRLLRPAAVHRHADGERPPGVHASDGRLLALRARERRHRLGGADHHPGRR